MKHIFYVVLVTAVFFACTKVNAEPYKEHGYISLNSTVTEEVDPNLATISFAVENIALTAQKASAENKEISNKIINALNSVLDKNVDVVKTSGFSVRPIYHTKDGIRSIKNYSAVNSVTVQTKDINKVSEIIDTAIDNGANRTDGLSFTYEDDKSVCDAKYAAALKELRTRANALASAAGTSVTGVKHINVSCSADSVASNGRFFAAKSVSMTDGIVEEAAKATPVQAGRTKVRIYVNADFYLK